MNDIIESMGMKNKKEEYNLDFLRIRALEKKKEAEKRVQALKEELKEDFEVKRKTSRKISVVEGSFNAVADGTGARYISPFALSLGANNAQIGLLSAIPSLIGNFTQMFSSKVMENYSRKKTLLIFTTLQAIMWLFIILAGMMFFFFKINSGFSVNYLILVYTILVALGAFVAPIWASWMKDIVDPDKSGKYFGARNKVVGLISLFSMLIGGFILDYFKNTKVFIGFFILFSFCFIARFISSQLFVKKYEPKLQVEKSAYFSLWQFIKKMSGNNFGRFVISISVMNLAINLASPFFAVYMLKELGFSYANYTAIIVSSIIGNLLFMPFWGRFSDKYGNIKTIKISAMLTALIPIGWFLSFFLFKNIGAGITPVGLVIYLVFVEFLSGAIFAGFSLASGNFIYDAVTRQRMALCTAYFNIINGIGVFIGASIGGVFASEIHFGFISIFLVLFLISGILRLFVALTFVRKINEVRMTQDFRFIDIPSKIKNLTPDRIWQYLDVLNFRAE